MLSESEAVTTVLAGQAVSQTTVCENRGPSDPKEVLDQLNDDFNADPGADCRG